MQVGVANFESFLAVRTAIFLYIEFKYYYLKYYFRYSAISAAELAVIYTGLYFIYLEG